MAEKEQTPKTAQEFFHRANKRCEEEEDFDGAISDYDEVIREWPDYTQAWVSRGLAKSRKGDYDGAIADFDEAIRLQPDDAFVWMHRSFSKTEIGDHDGAFADMKEAIRLNPSLRPLFPDFQEASLKNLRSAQEATPLAERVEWVPETRKIRIVPVPMENIALWHVILDKLRDAAAELRNNPSLANSHAALAYEAERLAKTSERHKDSPQRVHDEIATTLEVMERLVKMREIPNDADTVRYKRTLIDCTLDIQGDVAEVRIVVEKRTALKFARISDEEREQLSSVTAEVILHIEDGRVREDMREDAKMLAEQPEEEAGELVEPSRPTPRTSSAAFGIAWQTGNTVAWQTGNRPVWRLRLDSFGDDSLQRKTAIYRLLSRLSRMLEVLKENAFVTTVAAGLTLSAITSVSETILKLLGLGG